MVCLILMKSVTLFFAYNDMWHAYRCRYSLSLRLLL